MIQIRCANCDGVFQADDEATGTVEQCPQCGAINDVPLPDPERLANDDIAFTPHEPAQSSRWRVRGIPSVAFWILWSALIGGFVIALILLFSPDWETQHLPAIVSLVTAADASVAHRDYNAAIQQYQAAIDVVGKRTIQSQYLQKLLNHARESQSDARLTERLEKENSATQPSLP